MGRKRSFSRCVEMHFRVQILCGPVKLFLERPASNEQLVMIARL